MKQVRERRGVLKKLNIELPYDPATTLLGTYPRELKSGPRKAVWAPMLIGASFTIANMRKQPQCPSTDEWISHCGPSTQGAMTQP